MDRAIELNSIWNDNSDYVDYKFKYTKEFTKTGGGFFYLVEFKMAKILLI